MQLNHAMNESQAGKTALCVARKLGVLVLESGNPVGQPLVFVIRTVLGELAFEYREIRSMRFMTKFLERWVILQLTRRDSEDASEESGTEGLGVRGEGKEVGQSPRF